MKKLNPEYKERLFRIINDSPFPAHLKMQITEIEYGSSVFVMSPEPFRMQPFKVAHGGNIATIIDSAAFWACFLAMGNDEDALTSVDLKLNYLAPVGLESLACRGTMKKAGKTLFYADAEVRTNDDRLIAHGTSTLMRIKGHGLRFSVPLFI